MSGCMSMALPTRAPSRASGVPHLQRKCAKAAAQTAEPPCAQCAAEAVHAGSAPNMPPAPPSAPSSKKGFEVGAPDDHYEREADRVANQVMKGSAAPPVSPDGAAPKLRRLPAATPNLAQAPAGVQQVIGGAGMPLDARTRSYFEPRFGRDFSSVRVHADEAADRSARAMDAQAYTVGHHVVFSRGKYSPAGESGKRLLAHELAHVVQQSHSPGTVPPLQRKKGRGKGPGSCGWLSAATSTVLGGVAHLQIQEALIKRGIQAEYAIPRASKTGGISRRCQPFGTPEGYADLARVSPAGMSVAEIKPYYIAKTLGKLEARHYRRRAEQSKQRLTGTGTCGKRSGPHADDYGFQLRLGPITLATTFSLLTGVISGPQENFGAFRQDKTVDLIAKEVGGGGVGYWCRLNAAGKKAEEEEKKKKKKKPKGKGGGANLGLGVSLGGSSASVANIGVGVSVDSNSATAGTIGASIAISSDSATAGAAGASSTQNTASATGGAAGVSKAKDGESVTVGAAGKSDSDGSTTASAGVAGSSKSKDDIAASAGQKGKSESSDNVAATAGGAGSGKTEGVVGAGKGGTPKKPIDPKDVSGSDAQKTPDGDAEQAKGDSGEGKGKPGGEGDKEQGEASGGDKEAGGSGNKGKGSQGGDSDKGGTSKGKPGQGGKGGGGTGGDKDAPAGDDKQQGQGGKSGDKGDGQGEGKSGKPVPGPGRGSGKGSSASSNPLGVYTIIPLGTSDADRDKIAAEAAKVAVLVQKASEAQKELLRHLSSNSPDKRYLVPASDWVQKMMNVTKGLSVDDIQYLKSLNWTPGRTSEAELRARIEKLLANKPKTAPKGEGGSMKAPDQTGKGGQGGKGGGSKASGTGGKQSKGADDSGEKATKRKTSDEAADSDVATDPPEGSSSATSGFFGFQITSGFTADSRPKKGTEKKCNLRVHDFQTEQSFTVKQVSVTFEERIETPVTIKGVQFVNVKFKVWFTKNFWSNKHKFFGKGGKDSITEVEMGRRRVKKK